MQSSEQSNSRAQVAAPKGSAEVGIPQGLAYETDDDFFHVTCHIEENLKEKIKKGGYVDLERLLPKDKTGVKVSEENKLEFFLQRWSCLLCTSVGQVQW